MYIYLDHTFMNIPTICTGQPWAVRPLLFCKGGGTIFVFHILFRRARVGLCSPPLDIHTRFVYTYDNREGRD